MTVFKAGALGAIALALTTTLAAAQTTSVIVAKPSGYVLVNPEQEVLVQRYVVSQPGTTVTLPSGYAPTVGSVVPATVELSTFGTTADYGGFDAGSYRYVVAPNYGTVLVEPGTRRVIQVIR
ncbi:MAG: DUF1236 domain-containing protein [Rhizobiales bacterium]|nr:DUF1236 domain-containing protein [Hyphomicrobiales bacterium]